MSKPIRLLYATPETHPTYRADIKALFGIYLPETQVASDLVTLHDGAPEPWPGGQIFSKQSPKKRALFYFVRFFHILATIITQGNRSSYDAVQIRDMPILAVFAYPLIKIKGLKCFYWMSFPIAESKVMLARERKLSAGLAKFLYPLAEGFLGLACQKLITRLADHVFVQSPTMKQEQIELGISPEKLTPVPMGVDLKMLYSLNLETPPGLQLTQQNKLIYMGTLDRSRNIPVLFGMLEIVLETYPDTLLILAGDTEDVAHQKELKETIKHKGLQANVYYTGWLSVQEAWQLAKISDVGLSPYPRGRLLDSASPTKIIEYMALGLPVVANDQPDQVQIIAQSHAGICSAYTETDFAESVMKILAAPDIKQQMREAGPAWVNENRDYAQLALSLSETYREILQPTAQ